MKIIMLAIIAWLVYLLGPFFVEFFRFMFTKKDSQKKEFIEELKTKKELEAEKKGASFENQILDTILYYFPGSKVYQNLIIKNKKFSKEIDLIALTQKGFIIIEAKNYSHCEINGNTTEKFWECRYNEKESYPLYNPLFQVSSGVWNVKKHIPDINFEKAVVFSDRCKISKTLSQNNDIYTLSSFRHYLLSFMEHEDIYTTTFIEEVNKKLDDLNTVSKSEHIKNVEKIRKMS